MERAGAAAAALALRLLDGPGSVLVACGPGNNGGDGFVVARHLKAAGLRVVVAFAGEPAKLPADAAAAHAAWLEHGGSTSAELPPPPGGWSLVVDALFGIGLQRPLDGRYADWIATLNAQPCPRLALDIPSGLDADTGRRLGPCFAASHTVSFIALKPGLLTLDGPDQCGELHLRRSTWTPKPRPRAGPRDHPGPLRRPAGAPGAQQPQGQLRRRRADRRRAGHGRRGHPGRPGRGHLGAGRVLVGLLDPATLPVDILRPELMFRSAPELLAEAGIAAFAVGPGSASRTAWTLVHAAIALPAQLVLDADALNLVAARDPGLQAALAHRSRPAVLTPHPAEAARLLGSTTADVQADRIAAACRLAGQLKAWVVLKGCGSIVANPDGHWWINTSGNPAMATAGMGDVLSGILAALLARGWDAGEALLAAVHLHGLAGDRVCAAQGLDSGLLADELAPAARACFNAWVVPSPADAPQRPAE
jgi:hydroxyethylthiazole kinase-like uncharacterized protein yjeF